MTPNHQKDYAPITTPDYWQESWRQSEVPRPIDPANPAPENHYYRCLDSLFREAIVAHCGPGSTLVEIGCGGSRWLPYFESSFGYNISGIDYSEAGLDLAGRILGQAGSSGSLVKADMFDPPPGWVDHFDVVASFGVVEHFSETATAVAACARYLRPGGRMITLVPTMRGFYGLAYRLLRPSVYQKHVPQSRASLARAHADAGMEVTLATYVLGAPGLLTEPQGGGMLGRLAWGLSRAYWRLESVGLGIPPNSWTSPYLVCFSTKPKP